MEGFGRQFNTVAEVFDFNDSVRGKLISLVGGLSEEEASTRTEKGDWTVAGIVEHLAMAEEGMAKVAYRLLQKAKETGAASDGSFHVSDSFVERIEAWKHTKGEAPEMVRPTGERTIAESLAVMEENRRRLNELREMFETVQGTKLTFPHPAFGPLAAQDWLALLGGHESRHLEQIARVLGKEK